MSKITLISRLTNLSRGRRCCIVTYKQRVEKQFFSLSLFCQRLNSRASPDVAHLGLEKFQEFGKSCVKIYGCDEFNVEQTEKFFSTEYDLIF